MKRHRLTISLLLLSTSFLYTRELKSQWSQAFYRGGMEIICFTDDSVGLFAGTSEGVLLSTDHGGSWHWQPHWEPFAGAPSVLSLAGIGTNVFAAIGDSYLSPGHGILRSTDEGYSWTPVGYGLTDSSVTSLAVIGTTIFAGTSRGGVFRSTDSGVRWKQVNHGLPNDSVRVLVASGTDLFAGTLGGLSISTNGGDSWTTISNGLPDPGVRVLAVNGSSIILGLYRDLPDIYFSSNNGANYGSLTPPPSNGLYVAFVFSGPNIFASASENDPVVLSTDSGRSWHSVSKGAGGRASSLTLSGPNLVLGSGLGPIWVATVADLVGSNGVSQNPMATFNLSPNPTTGIVSVQGAPANTLHVSVTNVLGKSMIEVANPRFSDLTLDLSNLPRGTYFVRLESAGGVVMKKVVKE